MKSSLDNYESLTPSERVKLCYDLRESLNKATVILDKLMLDALRSLPTSTGQRIIEIDPDDHFMQFITDIEGDRAELPETSELPDDEGEGAFNLPLTDKELISFGYYPIRI